jgi:hypothetical protein
MKMELTVVPLYFRKFCKPPKYDFVVLFAFLCFFKVINEVSLYNSFLLSSRFFQFIEYPIQEMAESFALPVSFLVKIEKRSESRM